MQAIVGVLIVGALLPLLLLPFVREKPIFNQELGLLTLLGIAFGMIMFVTVFGVQAFQNRQMIKRLAVQATPKANPMAGSTKSLCSTKQT